MYRISPSMLDGISFYRQNDFISFPDFLARVRGDSDAASFAAAGTGKTLHRMLENASVGDCFESVGGTVAVMADTEIEAFPLRELKAVKVLQTRFGRVAISGIADAVNGNEVIDYKVTFSSFPAEKYFDSLQWRIYLWMFECTNFRYIIFQGRESKKNGMSIDSVSEIFLFRYPNLESDVTRSVEDYISFLIANDLEYLVDRTDDSEFYPEF